MKKHPKLSTILVLDGPEMPKPSLRHNLLALVGLYAFSLVVAAGCPTAAPKPAENAVRQTMLRK